MKTYRTNFTRILTQHAALALVLVSLVSPPAHAAILLEINVGIQPLLSETPGQPIDLFINNTGSDDFITQGATLKFEIDDGLGGGNAPVITGIDLITGTVFQSVGTQTPPPPGGFNAEFAFRTVVDFGGARSHLGCRQPDQIGDHHGEHDWIHLWELGVAHGDLPERRGGGQ